MENKIQKTESPLSMAASLVQTDDNIDVEKLSKLLEMQERYDATQAKKAYVQAMANFKANPPEIIKDKDVSYKQTQYSHASLGNVTATINKALSEHGLTASWVTSQDNGSVKVICKITHIMGHSEETCLSAPPDDTGSKNVIQAIGSTVTYLQRYTLLALTGLATYDQDDDGKGADDKPQLPTKPNEDESKVLDAICEILEKEANLPVLKDKVAAIFYAQYTQYPKDLENADIAAQWVIDLDRQDEWAKEAEPVSDVIETLLFGYETEWGEKIKKEFEGFRVDYTLFLHAIKAKAKKIPSSADEKTQTWVNENIELSKVVKEQKDG